MTRSAGRWTNMGRAAEVAADLLNKSGERLLAGEIDVVAVQRIAAQFPHAIQTVKIVCTLCEG